MLGNFSYHNATKLYFGEDSLEFLNEELPKYGEKVQLIYGGGSVKRNGIYDAVVNILKANGKTVVEDGGVMPNPTVPAAITRRRFRFPFTVTTIRGTNTSNALKNRTARFFLSDAC